MGASLLPIVTMSVFWGVVGLVLPWFMPKGPNKGLLQIVLILTAFCCWLFWLCCYMAQMNPLIGPKLSNKTLILMHEFWGLDVRWIWRYRLFYIVGITVMSVQIFLAIIFFTLYEEMDKNSSVYMKNTLMRQDLRYKSAKDNGFEAYKLVVSGKAVRKQDVIFDAKFGQETFGLSVVCNISGREAISAIKRAKTAHCKQLILNTTCALQNGQLYPKTLPHFCPTHGLQAGKYLGCFRDNNNLRLLNGAYYNTSKFNSPTYCLGRCVQAGFSYAGVQFADECFCGNDEPPPSSRLSDTQCNTPCPFNASEMCGGYLTLNIFETGVSKFRAQVANEASTYVENSNNPPVRIVFLLTLNGRAVRQVYRLIKMLFHRDHFFFIHVDERQDYMFRELLSLEMRLSNVRLSRRRYSTIWGGASLLTMLLQSMSELIQSSWDWDFLINVSESDFPIKTNEELVAFLTINRNRNFVKSHGRDVHHFIHKQGLDKTFVECDEHMWRIGNKVLPSGIVIDGGSDWIALSRPFINYVVTALNDELLNGLKGIFKHTLLPAESFFHTVLRNSMFCDTYIDNNLHVTNWKRHLGCKCQYKHVVDWCGCSPNVFTLDNWSRIKSTLNKSLYFARKFDPIVSQAVINRVQEWLYGRYSDDFNSERKYWQNVFHHMDRSPSPDDVLTTVSSSLCRQMLNLLSLNYLKCKNIEFKKLLQVHAFYEDDIQKGILVHFQAAQLPHVTVELEVRYEIKSSFSIRSSNPVAARFISLAVNTNFDAKEKMSRNYVAAIGPFSEPVFIYQVVAGVAASNISLVWMSPIRTLVDVSYISLDELTGIHFVKPNLKTPLWPGEWTVYMIFSERILGSVNFVVSPLETWYGNPVTTAQTKILHGGSQTTSNARDWNHLIAIVQNATDDLSKLKIEAVQKSSYVGVALIDWVNRLISKWYKVVDFCVVEQKRIAEEQLCYQTKFQYCEQSQWSSFSPDLKTLITTVNKSTGRLN